MVIQFSQLKPNDVFVIGNCQYVKTEEHPVEYHASNTVVGMGTTNAYHITATQRQVFDYFGASTSVEFDNEIERKRLHVY